VQHIQEGKWGEGKDHAWSTEFSLKKDFIGEYIFCSQRLERQLENWKAVSPDHPVSVLFTSTGSHLVEFKFVDTKDGMSEWTYWFWHWFSKKERKELGSSV
jgi:hypothetical protein